MLQALAVSPAAPWVSMVSLWPSPFSVAHMSSRPRFRGWHRARHSQLLPVHSPRWKRWPFDDAWQTVIAIIAPTANLGSPTPDLRSRSLPSLAQHWRRRHLYAPLWCWLQNPVRAINMDSRTTSACEDGWQGSATLATSMLQRVLFPEVRYNTYVTTFNSSH